MIQNNIKKIYCSAYFVLLFAGIFLLLYQYMYNKSLWVDEAYLADNILERDWFKLLQPLRYNQVAPILFIYVGKLNSILFGPGEKSLRLFSLLCGMVCLPLFYSLSLKIIKSKTASLFGLFFIVFNISFIYYGTEFKQYIVDGTVALLLFNVYLYQGISLNKKICLLLILGILSIYFSNISVIYLATIGIHVVYWKIVRTNCVDEKSKYSDIYSLKWSILLYFGLILIVNFVVYYYFFAFDHPTKAYMQDYWSRHGAFVPLEPLEALKWIGRLAINYVVFWLHHKTIIIVCLLIFCYSFVHSLKNDKELFIIFYSPLIIHLILSAMKIYPLQGRLFFHYVFWGALILVYGTNSIFSKITSHFLKKCLFFSFCVYALFFAQQAVKHLPLHNQEMKQAITYVEKNIKTNDNLFVFFAAYPIFSYYKSIGVTNLGEDNKLYFMDNELGKEGRLREKTLNQLNSIEDKKTWFIFAQFEPNDVNSVYNRLSKRGKFSIRYTAPGVMVCLFDPWPSTDRKIQ